jgi:hypothetical protein
MLSIDLQDLLARQIPSPTGLKALLLLRRSPETYWTPAAAAVAIEVPQEHVADAMMRMEAADLLERASGTVAFRYNPGTPMLRDAIDRLAVVYEENRNAVLDVLRAAHRPLRRH